MRGHDPGPLEGERGLSIQGQVTGCRQEGRKQRAQRQKAVGTGGGLLTGTRQPRAWASGAR